MATQARVSSTEALETFRAALIVFVGKARRSVDDVGDDVRRTRQWLQFEQRARWESELRRRTKLLKQAQQELASVRFGGQHQESAAMARQVAVTRAKRAVDEAENKIKKVKGWGQNFEHATDPIYKRLGNIQHVLDQDLPRAITYLSSIQRTLADYAQTTVSTDATDFASATFAPPSAPTPPDEAQPVPASAADAEPTPAEPAAATHPAESERTEPAPAEIGSRP
jgi:hypothetical protein